MFWGRNKSKSSENLGRSRKVTVVFILINLQDSSKISCLIYRKLMRYKYLMQVDVNLALTSCRYTCRCYPVNGIPFKKRKTETCTM